MVGGGDGGDVKKKLKNKLIIKRYKSNEQAKTDIGYQVYQLTVIKKRDKFNFSLYLSTFFFFHNKNRQK